MRAAWFLHGCFCMETLNSKKHPICYPQPLMCIALPNTCVATLATICVSVAACISLLLWSAKGDAFSSFAASPWGQLFAKAVRSASSWGFDVLGSRGYSTQERKLSPISVCPGNSDEAPMTASRSMNQVKTRKRKGTSPASGCIFVLWCLVVQL